MVVKRHSTGMVIQMEEGEPVCFSRPSVDVLTLLRARIGKCTGVILTGIGRSARPKGHSRHRRRHDGPK